MHPSTFPSSSSSRSGRFVRFGLLASAVSLALVVGCGGKFVAADGDGGGGGGGGGTDGSAGDSGGSGNDGGSGSDGGSVTDGGAVDAGGASCAELQRRLDKLRVAARTCCPTCNAQQCTIAEKDLCCAISVSPNHQADGDAFAQAVQAYAQQCGPIACPATPCQVAPSLVCDPITSLCK